MSFRWLYTPVELACGRCARTLTLTPTYLGGAEEAVCPAGGLQTQEDARQQSPPAEEAQLQEGPGPLTDEAHHGDSRDHAPPPAVQPRGRQRARQQPQHAEEEPV